jgi:hypothetical protein
MIAGRMEMTPERRAKIGMSHRGMKRSIETRMRMREAAIQKNPELANKPYDPTKPTRKPRWQVKNQTIKISEETRMRMRSAKLGTKKSDETRKKIAESVRKTLTEKRNVL